MISVNSCVIAPCLARLYASSKFEIISSALLVAASIAILLAAFGPLRRGEICALTSRDIKENTITVSKSIVRSEDNEWITKSPKTYGSYRTIQMPEFFFKHIRGKKGALCNLNPDQLTREFERVLELCQLPHFRFHDLRHPYVKPTTKKFITFFEVFRAAS